MKAPIGVALLGAGRMGKVHARNLLALPTVRVVAVADPDARAREEAQTLTRAERALAEPEEAVTAPGVEAVLICSPTPTHAPLIELAARNGKAVFCEKPVALDLAETERALRGVEEAGVPFQIGFLRRFDPGYAEAKRRIEAGEIGQIEQFRTVGRDPGLPSLEYLRASGGVFRDQTIHEFDMARFLVGEVEEIFAWGAVRVDPQVAELGDVDTATTLMRFQNGALGVIENSRRAVYGYDIATEVFGERGKLLVQAIPKTPLWRFGEGGVSADHYHFFPDRFREAAYLELEAFFDALLTGRQPSPGPRDAIESLRLALAAARSLREGRPVKVAEVVA